MRPFARRFFESLEISGRRPTTASKNIGGYQAVGLLEPRLDETLKRADAALSLRYGTFDPWRCAFEVKYLTEGRNSRPGPARLTAGQVGWTYEAAREAGFDHVVTISADQPEGRQNPSRYEPDPEHLRSTGLSHLSWLKVLWIIMETRERDARILTPVEDRMLADFADYLQNSKIWEYSREVSLGAHSFAAIRQHCRSDGGTLDATDPTFYDVAVKWLQLTESVAQRLSIETGVLVHANGRHPTPQKVMAELAKSGLIAADFRTESAGDGFIRVEVDLVGARILTSWQIEVARLTTSRNPQARTRWRAVEERLASWPARRGKVSIFGPRRGRNTGTIVSNMAIAQVMEFAQSSPSEGPVPQRLVIAQSDSANDRGRMRGDRISGLVESKVLSISPWSEKRVATLR